MIRKAFVMRVIPGACEEYTLRHNPVWQELQDVLKSHGAHNYSIFLDRGTHQLFAYVEIEDEARWESIAKTGICQKWWHHMGDIMPTNNDGSPVSKDLDEVFHLA